MTAKCTVIAVSGKEATVRVERKSACAECHASEKACGACDLFLGDDRFECSVDNPISAQVGDTVIVQASSEYVIASAALLFILPLIVAALCYGIMCILNFSNYAPLGALGGIAVSYIAILLIEKSVKKKKHRMKITEIVK